MAGDLSIPPEFAVEQLLATIAAQAREIAMLRLSVMYLTLPPPEETLA